MCWPRVGEANPLFSVCITLCRWTATARLSMPLNDRGISDYLSGSPNFSLLLPNPGNRSRCLFIFRNFVIGIYQNIFYLFIYDLILSKRKHLSHFRFSFIIAWLFPETIKIEWAGNKGYIVMVLKNMIITI